MILRYEKQMSNIFIFTYTVWTLNNNMTFKANQQFEIFPTSLTLKRHLLSMNSFMCCQMNPQFVSLLTSFTHKRYWACMNTYITSQENKQFEIFTTHLIFSISFYITKSIFFQFTLQNKGILNLILISQNQYLTLFKVW